MRSLCGILTPFVSDDDRRRTNAMRQMLAGVDTFRAAGVDVPELGVVAGGVGTRDAQEKIWNEDGTLGLVLLGELYWDAALDDRQGRDRVMAMYEAGGPACLQTLNGWFAGLLVDRRRKAVHLFTDRFGLGRLYVHRHAGKLFFASEAKALLRHAVTRREWDWRSLAEFVELGCTLQDRTLYRSIDLLPAGSVVVHTAGAMPETRRYVDVADARTESLSTSAYEAELATRFPRVLARYLRPHHEVGISLTGGLDTRMIMAGLPRDDGALPCYTFRSQFRDSRDVTVARAVARATGRPHDCITVGDEFLAEFPRLAARAVYSTDGAMDVSGAAGLYANERAAEIRPIRLTGNYGGEILRSLVAFGPAGVDRRLFVGDFRRLLDDAAATYAMERAIGEREFVLRKQLPWHHYARFALERSVIRVRSPFLDNDLVALASRAPVEERGEATALAVIARGDPALARIPTDRALAVRTPWGTRRVAHPWHRASFKAEWACDVGMPHALARADRRLRRLRCERLVLGRHKFDHFRLWYRDALAPHVENALLGAKGTLATIADPRAIEAVVGAHVDGRGNYTREIHRLLSIDLIDRLLIAAG